MATSSYKLTMLFSIVLFLLSINIAESRIVSCKYDIKFYPINSYTFQLNLSFYFSIIIFSMIAAGIGTNPALICSKIYGANIGDTCFSIMQQFSVTPEAFTTFNPNLNCDKMFVGEWICLDGSSFQKFLRNLGAKKKVKIDLGTKAKANV